MNKFGKIMLQFRLVLPLAILSLFLAQGCVTTGPSDKRTAFPAKDDKGKKAPRIQAQKPPEKKQAQAGEEEERPEKPSFKMLEKYKPASPAPETGLEVPERAEFDRDKKVRLTIEDMPVADYIHFFFGELLDSTYIVEDGVKGARTSLNINMKEELTLGELYKLSIELLRKNNIWVVYENGMYKIGKGPLAASPSIQWGRKLPDTDTPHALMQVIPIKYMRDRIPELKNLIFKANRGLKAEIAHIEDPDLLVVTGEENAVESILNMVQLFDRPFFSDRHIGMVNLTYWSTEEFLQKITELLRAEGIPVAKDITRSGVTLIPIPRLRSFVCFSREKGWLERIRYWRKILDVPGTGERGKEFFVYFPRYARASDLGEILESILPLSFEAAGKEEISLREETLKGEQPAGQEAPGSKKSTAEQEEFSMVVSTSPPGQQENLSGLDVSVVVDENRNALIIYCSSGDYKIVKDLLEQIDTMPHQVLIEVTIAEITLKGDLQYGMEWYLKHTGDYTGTLSTLGNLGMPAGGITYSLLRTRGKFEALLGMLAKDTDIRILSNPHLTVRDNQTASINIGQEVPVVTSETTSDVQEEGTTRLIRSIQYRSTGTILHVTPTINSRDMVTLEISQVVSEAQTNTTSNIDSPLILNRSLETKVSCRNGQSIFLGGIISEKDSKTLNKVPFLGDLPILGWLFKTESKSKDKTEIVLLVTPRILGSTEDIDTIRDEILQRMKLLDEEQIGGHVQ